VRRFVADPVERALLEALDLLTPEQREKVAEIKARPDREEGRRGPQHGKNGPPVVINGVRYCGHSRARPVASSSKNCRPCNAKRERENYRRKHGVSFDKQRV
jgi:hypothetical protein